MTAAQWGATALAAVAALSLAGNVFLWRAWDERRAAAAQLTARVEQLQAARKADELAQSLRGALYDKAHQEAEAKRHALDNIPDADGMSDAAFLDALRRGLLPEGANGGADAAGKPAGGLPNPSRAGGADGR